MKNIVFFTEAGEGIGFGHVIRMKALYEELNPKNNCNFYLFFKGNKKNIFDFDFQRLNWIENDYILNDLPEDSIIIIDSYLSKEDFYIKCKKKFYKTIIFDDYNRIKYYGNLIINPNLYGHMLNYSNQNLEIISGEKYIILRKQFRKDKKEFKVKEKINSILITLGGSDYRNLLPEIINMLKDKDYGNIKVLCGNEKIKKVFIKKNGYKNFEYFGFVDQNKMIDLLLNIDVVISSAGQTMHELAYLGIPTVSICIDHDQEKNIEYYFSNNFILAKLNWNDFNLMNKINLNIEKLKLKKIRDKISQIGKNLIDGKGVERISKLICD